MALAAEDAVMGVQWRLAVISALATAIAGCAELTAERPLFSVADQGHASPIATGVWIAISEQCPERHVRTRGRFPAACSPFELRPTLDGAWRFAARADLAYGLSAEERAQAEQEWRPREIIIASAVERALDEETFAPLYIAEVRPADAATGSIGYAVIVPVGAIPATEMLVLVSIDCDQILRDGPIADVALVYETRVREDGTEERTLSSCVAATQAAVREAARRAVIENTAQLGSARYMRARP